MSKKVVGFDLIVDHNPSRFVVNIRQLLNDGWQLNGETKMCPIKNSDGEMMVYAAALVKYED